MLPPQKKKKKEEIFQTQVSPSQLNIESAYFGKLFSSVDRTHNSRNGICNDTIHLVILWLCGSIYLKVKDYETKNTTNVDIKYEQEDMTSISSLLFIIILSAKLSKILSVLFVFGKWNCILFPPKGGQVRLMSPPCPESQGCHLISLCYLLSCSSAYSCYPFCFIFFCLLVLFSELFAENSSICFVKR